MCIIIINIIIIWYLTSLVMVNLNIKKLEYVFVKHKARP